MWLEKERRKDFSLEIEQAREFIIFKHRLCKGTGFIEHVEKRSGGLGLARKSVTECKCRKKFETISKFIFSNIPYRVLINQQIYGKLVFDCISGESIELRNRIIKPYIKNLKLAIKSPYGFLFLGKNGTGKTFVGLKLLYYSIISGFTSHNLEFSEFLKISRKIFDNDREAEALLKEISSVDLLMIDEIGGESKRSEFSISELKSLFKRRVSVGKPTIMISNYSYDDFRKVYGKSVTSMVQSHCKIFDFREASDVRVAKCSSELDAFFRKIRKR